MNRATFYFLSFIFLMSISSCSISLAEQSKDSNQAREDLEGSKIKEEMAPKDMRERLILLSRGLGYATFTGLSVWAIKHYLDPAIWKQTTRYWKDKPYKKTCDVLFPIIVLLLDSTLIYANYKYRTVQNAWKYLTQAFK